MCRERGTSARARARDKRPGRRSIRPQVRSVGAQAGQSAIQCWRRGAGVAGGRGGCLALHDRSGEGNRVVNSRELRWDYVIEAKVEGPMFSVESLLLDGRALFENVTRKILDPSIFAVEMGHIVPCPDSPGGQETAALLEAQRLLREAVDAGTGVLHSEWIMTAQGPYLVECAGRAPGDSSPSSFP